MKTYDRLKLAVCLLFLAGTLNAAQGIKPRKLRAARNQSSRVISQVAQTARSVRSTPRSGSSTAQGTNRALAAQVLEHDLNSHGQRLTAQEGVNPLAGRPALAQGNAALPPIDPAAASAQGTLQRTLETLQDLASQYRQLAAENQQLSTVGLGGGFGKSVLFAPLDNADKTDGFSVTAIEVDGEIFGVIASHVLAESYYTYSVSLHKNFHIQMLQADGSTALLDAQVVQVSPRSMLDISLVKFSPQAEQLVQPFSISQASTQPGELLFSYGFADAEAQQIGRTVIQNSFVSVRTDQHLVGKRSGFCGSPLLDANGNIKAIHTGTVENRSGTDAVSYGTHARFIQLLVDAYHNGGQAEYDVTINDQTFARLNVDEYISAVYLYNAEGKRILQRNWENKFAQSELLRMLDENPQAAYLQLTSRKAHWETDSDGDSILKEDRSKNDRTKRQHWYNLQTHEILPARPDVVRM